MRLPDLESLRCFASAATTLNFRASAREVALSPAAFGDRIKRLEEQLGVALFHRTTRRVALSAAGEALVPQARRALDEAERCLSAATGGPRPYDVLIGTRFELGLSWLTPSLGALKRAHAERTLHLYFGDSDALLAGVRRGTVDCAVSSVRLGDGDLRYALLHPEEYALVASPRLLRHRPFRRPADARGTALLDLHPDLPLFRYLLDARPPAESWEFSRIEHLGTIGAVRLRVLEGAGVAVLPRYFIRDDVRRGRLREPIPGVVLLSDHFRLIWRAGHPREAALRMLAEELWELPLR